MLERLGDQSFSRLEEDFFQVLPVVGSGQFVRMISFCEVNKQLIMRYLPPFAAILVGAVGFKRFFHFILRHGGKRVYFPAQADECSHRLQLHLSADAYVKLLEYIPTNRMLEVPSHWGIYSALRRVHIIMGLEDGLPDTELYRRYGVSHRYLVNLRKAEPGPKASRMPGVNPKAC